MRLRCCPQFKSHWSQAVPARVSESYLFVHSVPGQHGQCLGTSATHGMVLQALPDERCGPWDEKLVTGLGTPTRYKVTFYPRQEAEEAKP